MKYLHFVRTFSASLLVLSLLVMPAAPAFALGELPVTPPADTTPPVISGVAATSVSSVSESLVWTTNELAVSTFEYGTTMSYGSSASISASLAIGGTATLINLSPSTTYHYCIHATDASNNTSQSCSSFTTAAAPVVILPPVISLNTVTSIATSSTTITWTTDTSSDTQVHYGTTSSYSSSSSLNSTLGLIHSVTLANLSPNTTYHYQVASRDASGNLTTSSDATFTTNSLPVVVISDTTPPVVANIVASTVSSVAESIAWTTNELATSTIRWSTNTSYSSTLLVPETAGLAHIGALVGLSPSTTYNYCIDATDLAGNTSSSCGHTFTTAAAPLIPDTTAPVIVDVSATSLEPHVAAVIWTTDELAVSTLEYGTTMSYGSSATLPTSALLSHSATILGLEANTKYYYCIHATDVAGNAASSCGSINHFTTAAHQVNLDTLPPTISVVTVAPIATTTAGVTWTTDEVANGYVEYGVTDGYGSETQLNTALSLTHNASISGLTPGTTYHYRVHSSDEAGNTSITPDETFTTGALPAEVVVTPPSDTTPPAITDVTEPTIGASNTTINWITNELAVSTLEYGTTTAYGSSATLSASALLLHDATLTGLTHGATYYYCIHATDLAGNSTSSCGHSFTTTNPPLIADSAPPVVSVVAVASVATSSATITWTNDELAYSYVEYGATSGYGSETSHPSDSALTGSATITGLTPATTYHFRVRSRDASVTVGYSGDETFTTDALPVVVVQTPSQTSSSGAPASVVISAVEAASLNETGATITWTTNLAASSRVEYGENMTFDENASSATLNTSHSVTLTGLDSDTTYDFRVVSKPAGAGAVEITSPVYDFSTLAVPIIIDPAANILSVSASSVGATSASVGWMTDERTSGSVEYGLTTAYGASTTPNASLQTSGNTTLSGLLSGTTYHFRVKAVDAADNITYSEDHTLITSGSVSTPTTNESTSVPSIVISSGGGGGGGSSSSVPTPALITASGVDSQVVFMWNTPESGNVAGTVIVRKEGLYPGSPSDGQVIYQGNSSTFTDTSLQNGKTYYYTAYSYTTGGQYSNPIHISTSPQAGVGQVQLDENPVLQPALAAQHFPADMKFGDKNLEVVHLQQILNTVEVHPSKLTTGYFGPLTVSALKTFQAKYNLPQTGAADAATRVVLDSLSQSWMIAGAPNGLADLTVDLKRGDSGQDVADLQEFLDYEGSYEEGIISGTYGPLTQESVADFQTKHGVTPVSGYVGYKTRHTIQTVLGL